MVFFVAIVASSVLLALIFVQAVIVRNYHAALVQNATATSDRSFQPPVNIVLCLRGNDPSLKKCLQSLLSQQYGEYRVVCVFDSESDPAWSVVKDFAADLKLSTLVARPTRNSCSLKCNSLVKAFQSIEDPIVVLVDADTVVDENWLADLVAPLAEDEVVASSGNRWFLPPRRNPGSYVRYLWNMAAAPQMYLYQITWGGSLALKTEFVRDSGLLEIWSSSLFEDATVSGVAASNGKRVSMIPGLLVPNQESISIKGASNWITRQLLDTRLYHRNFPLVAWHAFLVAGALVAVVLTMVQFLFSTEWSLAIPPAICLVSYALFYWWCWRRLDKASIMALQKRGHDVQRRPINLFGWLAVLVTQVVYTVSTWRALWMNRVWWRGIEYKFKKPYQIQMVEFHEMKPRNDARSESI